MAAKCISVRYRCQVCPPSAINPSAAWSQSHGTVWGYSFSLTQGDELRLYQGGQSWTILEEDEDVYPTFTNAGD